MYRRVCRFCLLLAFLITACTTGGGGGPSGSAEVYFNTLPDFPEPEPAYDRAIADAEFDYGDTQVCSTTTYEISDAPAEVIMFTTDPQVFWPGALIQGNSYMSGSPLLLPLANRAPLNISIQGLYASESSAFDVTPAQSSVNQAVQGLLAQAVQDTVPTTQSVFFNQQEAYSFEQAALKLGFSARYLGARVRGSLSYETTSEQNTIVANATIRTFTVSVDQPPTPSDFFAGLSQAELDEQIALGRMGPNNLPVYVASITYGQIMMFSATSSASMSNLRGALSASFNTFAGGASARITAEQQQLLQESEVTVVTLGGSEDGVQDMIRNGRPADFFTDSTVVTSSVPIGYTLKDLHGNIVKVGELSQYPLTTCSPNGFANFYAVNQSPDGELTGYYADGTRATLNESVSTSAQSGARGIAYNSLDDLLYILKAGFVDIYNPDGSRPSEPVAHGDNNFSVTSGANDITYDPNNARLYLVGYFSGDFGETIVEAWTLDGFHLNIPFRATLLEPGAIVYPAAVTFDASRDRIYVTAQVVFNTTGLSGAETSNYNTVLAFDIRGNQVALEGDFSGMDPWRLSIHDLGISYAPGLDRIYVSNEVEGTVRAFDAEGNAIELANPITGLSQPAGLYFDETYNRLYVLEKGASLISVFEPDGSKVTTLARPPFPGLQNPIRLAFRPS